MKKIPTLFERVFENHKMKSLCILNAQCALIAIMRFWYITNNKTIKESLKEYMDFFYPIAINKKKINLFTIRCMLFKYFKPINSIMLYFADFFRNRKYKSNPKIMG